MLLFLPYTVLSQSVLLGLWFIHNSALSPGLLPHKLLCLRMVPTIVTVHTFCAFRDFPCGTRDAWVNFNLLLQCSFATLAFALSTYTGSNGQEKKTQQEIQLYQKQAKRSFFEQSTKKMENTGKKWWKREGFGWLERWENSRNRVFSRPVDRRLQWVQNKMIVWWMIVLLNALVTS